MQIATETLKLIEQCVAQDGGNAYRKNLGMVLPHIGDAYRSDEEGFRSHLGASLIGKTCGRSLWYSFRWFVKPTFSGRLYRLFNRGHLEEGRFIAILLSCGIQVFQQDSNGNQFRISGCGGHFGGSGDGIALGIPDIPVGKFALLEFKTHNRKSFEKLKKEGVRKAKPEHFVQMQMYLEKMGLYYAAYFAVNKDDDEIYCEIVTLDQYTPKQFEERADKIIFSPQPLDRISNKESWYECKWCDFHAVCHKGAQPEVNCRTCLYSTPERDGTWVCRMDSSILEKEKQLKGCENHAHFQG